MLRFSVIELRLGTDRAHTHCKQSTSQTPTATTRLTYATANNPHHGRRPQTTRITDADCKQPLGCSPVTLHLLGALGSVDHTRHHTKHSEYTVSWNPYSNPVRLGR